MKQKLFWVIAIFAILTFICIPLATVVWADEDEDDDDDDRDRLDYRRVWQKLEDGIWLVYRSKIPKETIAKYGLKTATNCPEVSECQKCVDDIEFVYTLEEVEAADLSTFTAYAFNGRMFLVPTWVSGVPTPEPPPPPEPEWEPSKENLKDDFSCAKCHDGEDATKDKFQRAKWNPDSSGELHKKHSKTCTKCHVEGK